MTEKITLDQIQKLLWDMTGFKADAVQTDALAVLLQAYAADLAGKLGETPGEVTEAYLHTLRALAAQLLDTSVRFDVPEGPVATRQDVQGLAKAIKILAEAADTGALLPRMEELLASQKAPRTDLSRVTARLDNIENLIAGLERGVRTALSEQANLVSVMLDDVSRPADLSPVQAQLEALTKAVFASQSLTQGVRSELAGDLTGLHEELWKLRQKVDALSVPAAYIPLEPVGPAFDAKLSDEVIASIKADAAAGKLPVRKITVSPPAPARPPKGKHERRHDFPGCFFNEDGTITCKDCGQAKQPQDFYADKAAWTGRKSSCKDCESSRKLEAKAARGDRREEELG